MERGDTAESTRGRRPTRRIPLRARWGRYFGSNRVPDEWRAWVADEIRSSDWGPKSAAWITALAGLPMSTTMVIEGWYGPAALVLVGLLLGGLMSTDYRRREALDALATGRSYDTVPLRWWDLLLAASVGGAVVVAVFLFVGR